MTKSSDRAMEGQSDSEEKAEETCSEKLCEMIQVICRMNDHLETIR